MEFYDLIYCHHLNNYKKSRIYPGGNPAVEDHGIKFQLLGESLLFFLMI